MFKGNSFLSLGVMTEIALPHMREENTHGARRWEGEEKNREHCCSNIIIEDQRVAGGNNR